VLIRRNLVPKVRRVRKGLDVEELRFLVGMEAFHIRVGIGVATDAAMMGGEELLDGVRETAIGLVHRLAVELAAAVGLDDDVLGGDAIALQVLQQTTNGEFGIGDRQFAAVGQERGAGLDAANGVLEFGQAKSLHLRPVVRDVVEVFDIHLEMRQGGVTCFDVAEITFGLVFAFFASGQTVLTQDASDGADRGF